MQYKMNKKIKRGYTKSEIKLKGKKRIQQKYYLNQGKHLHKRIKIQQIQNDKFSL